MGEGREDMVRRDQKRERYELVPSKSSLKWNEFITWAGNLGYPELISTAVIKVHQVYDVYCLEWFHPTHSPVPGSRVPAVWHSDDSSAVVFTLP